MKVRTRRAIKKKDRLETIVGIGPKCAETLHTCGIYTYQQISALSNVEIETIEDVLNSPGRVERENWINQANALIK